MSGSVVDAFVKSVTGVVRVGKDVGGRAVETAGPRIVSTVEAMRSRLTGPHPKPATAPTPEKRLPHPKRQQGGPNPATVAKNIAKHDPATEPVIPKRKPVKPSVPGAKLPAPKRA
ncbi:MAG TPA: hypothetical protein VNQ53_18295 [Nocardioides sp.]|nr:hypothetical protein [Nocardioides sp.]